MLQVPAYIGTSHVFLKCTVCSELHFADETQTGRNGTTTLIAFPHEVLWYNPHPIQVAGQVYITPLH